MLKMRRAGRTFCLAALRLVLFPFTPDFFSRFVSFVWTLFLFFLFSRDIVVAQFRLNDEHFSSQVIRTYNSTNIILGPRFCTMAEKKHVLSET
jgi:hypothetical protein